jgi:hypothetical protein
MPILDKRLSPQLDNITMKQIDQSVVNWFNTDFPITIDGRKVPVIYATAERWAKAQKEKGFRDESGVLILPLVSIRRTIPDSHVERYVPEADETNITLTRRFATNPDSANDPQPTVRDNRQPDPAYINVKDMPVWEVTQLPFPTFINLEYDVTVWTSYMTHQNIEQENLYREWRGGRTWVKVNDFYFFALLKSSQDQSNLDNFSDKEKLIKYGFRLLVQAYLIDKLKIKSFRTSANARLNVGITETSSRTWPAPPRKR